MASTSLVPLAHAQKAPEKKPAAGASTGSDAAAADKAAASAPNPPDKKTREAARKAYAAGEKAFNSGDYTTALTNFQQALELIPSPHAEYWVANSLDKLDRSNEAIAAYERFLANPGASKLGDDRVSESQARLEALKAKLVGEVNLVSTPPGATVSVDGQAQPGVTPMTVRLPPGAHKVTLTLSGYDSKDVEVNVAAGGKAEQTVTLTESAPEVPPAPAPAPAVEAPASEPPPVVEKRSKVPAYVTLGIAGAGAVVGTIFGLKALSAKSDYDDQPTTDHADDVERNALIADMAFGVAITLGVTGIVLLTSSDSSAPGTTGQEGARRAKPQQAKLKLNVAPYANQYGGGAAARLRF